MAKVQITADMDIPDDIPQDQYKNLVIVTKDLEEAQIAKIAELQSTITEQADLIRRLKEDAERLAETSEYYEVDREFSICVHCGQNIDLYKHTPTCPIALHSALMEKLKQEGIE